MSIRSHAEQLQHVSARIEMQADALGAIVSALGRHMQETKEAGNTLGDKPSAGLMPELNSSIARADSALDRINAITNVLNEIVHGEVERLEYQQSVGTDEAAMHFTRSRYDAFKGAGY